MRSMDGRLRRAHRQLSAASGADEARRTNRNSVCAVQEAGPLWVPVEAIMESDHRPLSFADASDVADHLVRLVIAIASCQNPGGAAHHYGMRLTRTVAVLRPRWLGMAH